MRNPDRSLLSNASALLVCGLLAGVVVAAAAFPAVALTGLLAKSGADEFDNLPSVLTVHQSPQISYVYASDGKTLLSTFYDENRRDVPLDQVSLDMRHAMVAAEDTRFYEHHGVDLKGVARAFVANQSSGQTEQGASTLTMQYVRQAIEYSADTPQQVVDATSDTTGRKLREMRYALALEKQLTKDQILERYLNIAPFGHGAYGIYAAAQVYFGKEPKDLNLAEASLLAGLVKAPSADDPTTKDGLARAIDRRNNYTLVNMVNMGYITEAQRQEAMKTQLTFSGKPAPNGCTSVVNSSWGFFCDYFYRWWLRQPSFGADAYERAERLKSGGYTIVTSLDVQAQAAATKNITTQAKHLHPSDALMAVGVEPGTGHIELMAVNRTFSNDSSHNGPSTNPGKRDKGIKGNYPNTTVPLLDASGYQFGSTFKMFTMLAALEQGTPLNYTINTTSPYVSQYMIDPKSPAACDGGHYCPVNDSPSFMNGVRNMWTGFGRSVNTYFVPLEEKVGAQNVVDLTRKLGLTYSGDPTDGRSDAYLAKNADGWGAFTLGVASVSPLEMANAYATVAADGMYCEPLPVKEIRDFSGQKLSVGDPRCQRALDQDVARAAADAARCPVGDQSDYGECNGSTAGDVHRVVGKPVAGKTGTTDNNQTAALIAMTRQLAIAGIVADPDNQDTHGYTHNQVNWVVEHTLADAMKGKPAQDFPKPSQSLAYGERASVPDVKCHPLDSAVATLKGAGFGVSVNSKPVASDCPAGTVAKTDPSGRTTKGAIIGVYISSGPAPGKGPGPGPGPGGTDQTGAHSGGDGDGGNQDGGGNDESCPIPLGLCPPGRSG